MKPLSCQALERVGKDWSVGKGTREAKLQTIGRFAEFVQHTFGLERIENLKPKHVQAYAASLHEQGVSARTGANYMAYVRDLCQAVGNTRLRKILNFAELAMERDKFEIFRKLTLDEFGKSGLIGELERGGRSRER